MKISFPITSILFVMMLVTDFAIRLIRYKKMGKEKIHVNVVGTHIHDVISPTSD